MALSVSHDASEPLSQNTVASSDDEVTGVEYIARHPRFLVVAALLVGLSAAVYPPKGLLGSSGGSSSAVSLISSASVKLADALGWGVFLALM